ncbi:MAG: endonuclease [Gammaproteobacteria bacterium]
MSAAYGKQAWWPGDSAFEISLGAILVQNTSWTNAARAIAQLRRRDLLHAESLAALDRPRLEALLRPAGCYRQKARRVNVFSHWWLAEIPRSRQPAQDTRTLRDMLLSLHGIGRETADCILLYAFGRPVFVVDAYTRRLLFRLGLAEVPPGARAYESLRAQVEQLTGPKPDVLGELHALIVEHGKQVCRARPLCGDCVLRARCSYQPPADPLAGQLRP